MAKTQDMTATLKEMMGAFPVDTKAMEDAFKTTATLNEKLSHVALEAAEKSTEISAKWTKDTLAKLGDMSKAKTEPADYAKAMTDFASAQAEMTAETMAAFAEVAADGRGIRVYAAQRWIIALPIPFLLIYADSWGWIVFANLLLGINQGLTWSSTVVPSAASRNRSSPPSSGIR